MSGHSKWSSIKHKKGKKTPSGGSCSQAVPRHHGGGQGGRRRSRHERLAGQRHREGQGYSMPKDNIERAIKRGAGGGRAAVVREHHLRGLRRQRRGDDRRRHDRQPQPRRRRRAPHLHRPAARWPSRKRRLDVRAQGLHHRRRQRGGRGRPDGGRHGGGRRGHGRGRRPVRDRSPSRRTSRPCSTP